jgi:hypothetical protein
MKTKTKKGNLCETCEYNFADCQAMGIKFGTGKGNDNVIECKTYKTKQYENN